MIKGEINFILNRWTNSDDNNGLNENLYEKDSSKIYFHLNHWISFFDKKDKINVNNLLNRKPIYYYYFNNHNLINISHNNSDLNFNEKIMKNFNKLFIINDFSCIEFDFYFYNEKKVLISFVNINDPLFEIVKTCKIKIFKNSNLINSIRRTDLSGLRVIDDDKFYDKQDFHHNFINNQKIENISREYNLKPFRFETFLITFK